MTATAPAPAEPMDRKAKGGIEVLPKFVPTPERVSEYLEMNLAQVMTEMESVEGREKLFQNLIEHQEDLSQLDPSFHPDDLREQLDLVAETLSQKKRFLEDAKSPEKKGMFRRAWEKVKGYAKDHPVKTTLLVLALVAAGVGGALYLSGSLQLTQLGVAADTIRKWLQGTDILNPPMGPMPDFNPLEGVPLGK